MSVDGVDFKIQNPTPFNRGWYSHKFKSAGLRYEVALCIATGNIVWTNGPFPCGNWPDIKIYRGWLKNLLAPNERVEADAGYRGDETIDGPEDCLTLNQYEKKFTVRGRHETVNARIKTYAAMRETWRHHRNKHRMVFNSVVTITQLELLYEKPLFQIDYVTDH